MNEEQLAELDFATGLPFQSQQCTLILVDKNDLYNKVLLLISDYRSDIPMEYHEKEAKEIVEELTYPSF